MRRLDACIFLTALLLALSACGGEKTPEPSPDPPEDPPSQEDGEDPIQEDAGKDVTIYDCGGIQVALPNRYLDLLTVQTEFSESPSNGWTPLISVSETASLEAFAADWGTSDGIGFLFGFARLDQRFYESVLREGGGTGLEIFARDDSGCYYARTFPTDVQFYRSGGELDAQSPEWQSWEELNALAPEVQADFIARNGLTPYTIEEFYDQEFTYGGDHVYIQYFPNYALDGSREECYTLVLSQPVRQGDGGIWCVERMTDQYDRTYVWFPDAPVPAAEYYAALQEECDAGEHESLLTPLGAAERFVEESFWFLHTPNTENFQELDRLPGAGN